MEAIGKLTGGIAHDFNNLLMIIGGSAQIFSRLLDPKLPRAIEAIQSAAKRGESLTRQLLTFSRHQPLNPTVIDLNASIRNMRAMIESSLRGNIVYDENVGDDVWPVKVDLAELELAIVNIAVNARDAMPNGGTFSLSVGNVTMDQGRPTTIARLLRYRLATRVQVSRQIFCPRCSIHFSRLRRSAKEPASVCRRSMVLRTKQAER